MNTKTHFVNQSERYGEQVEVTLFDYRELNPTGDFEIIGYTIVEHRETGDEVIAIAE